MQHICKVVADKRAAVAAAPCGQIPEYVGTRGDHWRAPDEDPKFRPPPAAQRCAQMQPAGGSVTPHLKLFLGPGAANVTVQQAKHATVTGSISKSDAVLVDSVAGRFECAEALAARLHGKRLCNVKWAQSHHKALSSGEPHCQSGQERGNCIHFERASQLPYTVAMSKQFHEEWPTHTKVLERVAPTDIDGPLKCLHIIPRCEVDKSDLQKPKHAKGTTPLLCLSNLELHGLRKRPTWVVGMTGLMNKLTVARIR